MASTVDLRGVHMHMLQLAFPCLECGRKPEIDIERDVRYMAYRISVWCTICRVGYRSVSMYEYLEDWDEYRNELKVEALTAWQYKWEEHQSIIAEQEAIALSKRKLNIRKLKLTSNEQEDTNTQEYTQRGRARAILFRGDRGRKGSGT